jgi:phosphoribosyl-AMP cyclohydrolase
MRLLPWAAALGSYDRLNMSQIPDFAKGDGLLPVIAQDAASGAVLMLGYMNHAAWEQTLATGTAVYYSRSRQCLWKKGEESGHVQRVKAVYVDCDADTILLQVEQVGGAACHEGYLTCFFRRWSGIDFTIESERVFDPRDVYDKPSH